MAKDLEKDLAEKIAEELQNEFEMAHLSRNLMNTIVIRKTEKGYEVEIPAIRYNIEEFRRTGQIIYDQGNDSYAEEVNVTGGFSGTHIGYVDLAISMAIHRWKNDNGLDIKQEETNG